jgi:hypothetical protein
MDIPLYNQRDSRWANQKINNTGSLIGPYGCTISCLAMAFTYSGRSYDPGQMEKQLRDWGAFQSDLVLWTKIPNFVFRFYCEKTPAPLDEIKKYIRQGKPVLLSVDLGGGVVKANHWVLCVDENFTIHDPWYNEIAPITKRYGKNPSIAILGGAYFDWPVPVAKPKEQPMSQVPAAFVKEIYKNVRGSYPDPSWPDYAPATSDRPLEFILDMLGEARNNGKDEGKKELQGALEQAANEISSRNSQIDSLKQELATRPVDTYEPAGQLFIKK